MSFSRKSFLVSFVGEFGAQLIDMVCQNCPIAGAMAKTLAKDFTSQLESWLDGDASAEARKILLAWIQNNQLHLSCEEEFIVENVMTCITELTDRINDNEYVPIIFRMDTFAQDIFLPIQNNADYSDREKREIDLALQYTIRTLLKQFSEKNIPQIIIETAKNVGAINDQLESYYEKLLSLSIQLNDHEYYIHGIEEKLHSVNTHLKEMNRQSITSFRYIIGQVPPMALTGFSNLHYMNSKMVDSLYGRDSEKNILTSFLQESDKFSFLVVSGPGGIGKSKLVYSLYLDFIENDSRWKCAYINSEILEKLSDCTVWDMDKDTLLIYDYAGSSPDLLHRCFSNIVNAENNFSHKLRFILIERIGCKEKMITTTGASGKEKVIEYPYWFSAMTARGEREYFPDDYLSKHLYDFINLDKLALDQYMLLVLDYSEKVRKFTLSESQKASIREFAKKMSGKNSRPLYLLAATDIVIDGQDISHWNTEVLMREICERDKAKLVEHIIDPQLVLYLLDALTYATIFGEWNYSCDFSILDGSVSLNIERALRNDGSRELVQDWLNGNNCYDFDLKSEMRIHAYEPDVVGEFFVLNQLLCGGKTLDCWCRIIYDDLTNAVPFIKRCGLDYANTSMGAVLKSLLDSLTKNDYCSPEKAETFVDLAFSLAQQKPLADIARESISTIVSKSDSAFRVLEELVSENYQSFKLMSYSLCISKLSDLEYYYENCRPSAVITSKYIELLGYIAYSNYRKAALATKNRNDYIRKGQAQQNKIQNVLNADRLISEDLKAGYVEAMSKILDGMYDAECYDVARSLISTVNRAVLAFNVQSSAVKYLDFYDVVIKNRDHYCDWNEFEAITLEFLENFDLWINHTDWPLYALHIASVLPHMIEGLFRVHLDELAEGLAKRYVTFYNAYKNATSNNKQNGIASNWLWVRRFESGISRIFKFHNNVLTYF